MENEIQYLFRFRDLVAKTIEEHQKILREHGRCWWGWWKRPTEKNREDIWKPLSQVAKSNNPVPVGLFDWCFSRSRIGSTSRERLARRSNGPSSRNSVEPRILCFSR